MSLLYCHQSFVYGAPPNNKRMPAHRWSQISTVSGHFTFSFDSSESIRLVVFAKPTIWLHNRLMPNQSVSSSSPIAGQCRYPLALLYRKRTNIQAVKSIEKFLCRVTLLKSAFPLRLSHYYVLRYSRFPHIEYQDVFRGTSLLP